MAANVITLTENTQLQFGTIVVTPSGGTVTVSTSGAVTGPAGFYFMGSANAGAFTASSPNTPNQAAQISFTAGTLTGAGTAMAINNFTTSAGPSPVFNSSGKLVFNVGANLVINSAQAGGSYTGTYVVTVIY